MVMDAELFRLPFELLQESGGAIRCIIPSSKLSAGRVDRNRYYIDFMNLPRDREGDIIERLLTGLHIPPGARAVFEEEYARFKKLRFIGVGPSHGRMTYRLYAGFTDDGVAHESTASSVEWVPGGEDSFVFKRYDELGSIPRARKVALVRESLSLPEQPAGGGSEAEQVAEAVVAIIDKAFGDLMAFQVQETAGQRRSVVFNYYRVAHTTSQEVAAELERLFQIFNIDPADSEAWLRDTRLLRLTDISVGTGWDGRPFVTFYQGLLSEPPEFIEDVDVNENAITADSPSAIAVTSEGKMDTSAQIDQPSPAAARLEAVTPAGSHELCEKCAAAPAHAEPRAPHRPNRAAARFRSWPARP